MPWLDKGSIKVSYANGSPEAQVKLKSALHLEEHPTLCEGRLPVQLNLCTPTATNSPPPPTGPASSPANGESIARL